jgi:hypothetical protein
MSKVELRSQQWFGKTGKDGFIYRAWMKNQGIPDDYFQGKPVIGICNTWSELTPCNAHFRELAEFVKKGVIEAGGFPVEFPVMSLGETLIKPTAMLYRNLASMDVEESIRANPVDGVVLMCGCDKTTPSLVMGASSVDLPTLVISGGPMMKGKFKGKEIGTSDVWRFADAPLAILDHKPEVQNATYRRNQLLIATEFIDSCRSFKGHGCIIRARDVDNRFGVSHEQLGTRVPPRRNLTAQIFASNLVVILRAGCCVEKAIQDFLLGCIHGWIARRVVEVVGAQLGLNVRADPNLRDGWQFGARGEG